jgi:uncharacterized protein (TIRG00374 family)
MCVKADIKQYTQKYWLFLFFVILFVLMALFKISLKDIWGTVSSLKLWQLLLLLSVYFLISTSVIAARKYLLFALSTNPKLKNLVYIHFSTMAAHYSTPAKLGFPLSVYLLKKFENVSYATGSAMIIMELVVSTGICGIISFTGAFFYFTDRISTLVSSFLYLSLLCLLTFFGIKFILGRSNENSRIYQSFRSIQGAFSQVTVSHLLIYTSLMIITQLIGSLTLFLLSSFFYEEIPFWQVFIANSTAFFLGAISMIPMGLGIREASILFYLRHLGITNEIGISIVTMQRLLSTGLTFVLGAIFGSVLGLKNVSQSSSKTRENSFNGLNKRME